MRKPSILIVGDDSTLLRAHTELLRDWQVVTASSSEAGVVIRFFAYDLLILSQTITEATVQSLLYQVSKLRPQQKALVIRRNHREWHLGSSAFYTVTSIHSCELQRAVARLLACDQSQALEIAHLRRMVS